MLETFGDLPLHPLVIHAVVVLGPLAALSLLVYVAVPRWRRGLRWPTVGLAVVSAVSGWVAVQSGEFFEDALRETTFGGTVPDFVEVHTEAGELAAQSLYGLLAVVLVVTLLLLRPGRPPRLGILGTVLAVVLAVLAAGAAGYAVFEAGHSGASAVWSGVGTG